MKNVPKRLVKPFTLLVISLGLLWFSEQFSPVTIFEPHSTGWVLWVSYAKDLIQPFAFYFFICLSERWLKTWRGRVLFAFAVPTLMELGQHLRYRVSTSQYIGSFDLMDIVMYALGVGFAVVVERFVFAKTLKFW